MATITSANKDVLQEEGIEFLDVTFLITGDGFEEERRLSFPIDTDSETIKEEIRKYEEVFLSDKQRIDENVVKESLQKSTDTTISELVGAEL